MATYIYIYIYIDIHTHTYIENTRRVQLQRLPRNCIGLQSFLCVQACIATPNGNPCPVHMAEEHGDYVWGMVVIGTHRMQNYLAMNDGIMECSIPDSHFELVPPKQVERLEENQEFLILGNGYPALRYLLVMRSLDGNSALFRGPVSVQDNIFAKKMPVVTIVIQLTAQLETRAEWDQPMLRFKAYKFITGECVKPDGWLLPSSDRVYPRQIADLAQHHVGRRHGTWDAVEVRWTIGQCPGTSHATVGAKDDSGEGQR